MKPYVKGWRNMPYVKQEQRPELDKIVELMIENEVVANGDLNYILFKLCRNTVDPSYNNYKNFISELNECGHEIRRRFLSDYETGKMLDNGDVI